MTFRDRFRNVETDQAPRRILKSAKSLELISDIYRTDQRAGLTPPFRLHPQVEAGHGFSVVAEEVQRLAERSGEATKQIGAIVEDHSGGYKTRWPP